MTESEFRERATANGFARVQTKNYAPGLDGPLHTHDFDVTLLVLEGEFALQYEDRKVVFQKGEGCDLAANVLHAERAGHLGAVVLLATRD